MNSKFSDFSFDGTKKLFRGGLEKVEFVDCEFTDGKMVSCSFQNVKLVNVKLSDFALKDMNLRDLTIDGTEAFLRAVKSPQ